MSRPTLTPDGVQRIITADEVLDLLREYEDTHESIADRLLGRMIGLDPARAFEHLEAVKRHLDERMLRSAGEPPRYVEDGFGSAWQMCGHPQCDLQAVRPGKAQCSDFCAVAASEATPSDNPQVGAS